MTVPINRKLVEELIERRYGSVDQLAAEWHVIHQANPKRIVRSRDRSTIYKWLDNGLPANKDTLFGFCGMLDVDPIGIIESGQSFIQENFAKERRAFQMSERRDSILAPFRTMYLPGWRWPHPSLAERHYGREWHVTEYLYEPGKISNQYAAFLLESNGEFSAAHPHVFHFAYMQKMAIDRLWRPYGVVIALAGKVRLISESGDWQEVDGRPDSNGVVAETFFGPRPCWFRVASLHPFELKVTVPSAADVAVRFH